MNYPLSERNWICRTIGHRYGRMYFAAPYVRQTCRLDGHTIPPMPTVPQSQADYDDWVARGRPKDHDGNWVPPQTSAPGVPLTTTQPGADPNQPTEG